MCEAALHLCLSLQVTVACCAHVSEAGFMSLSIMPESMLPGGEAIQAASTTATRAAEEAATGLWVRELDSEQLPKVLSPGMPHGVFGGWAEPLQGTHQQQR